MDENAKIQEFMRPECPVKVGEVIWRKYVNMTLPDPLRVEEITPAGDCFNLRCRYLQHVMGPYERTYSTENFKNQVWYVRRNKEDIRIVMNPVIGGVEDA